MTDRTTLVRQQYDGSGLIDRIKKALAAVAPEDQTLTVAQLAPLDQFHIRGLQATAELASAAGVKPSTHVLDIGCGVGGPSRYLVTTFGCQVTGVDLSPGFIDAAVYLSGRCGLSERVTFRVGDALHLPLADDAFDTVFLQHVAMNIEDRAGLYAEIRRVLRPAGRFATYDLVRRDGDVVYPVPWAREASASFLLSEAETRAALERAGFEVLVWRDDTSLGLDWFQKLAAGPPPSDPNLGVIIGPDFPVISGNLARNLRESRLGLLAAVVTRAAP